MPPEAIDLASRLLQYSPSLRCTAVSSTWSHLVTNANFLPCEVEISNKSTIIRF